MSTKGESALYADAVLYEPFVDSFSRMCHEDSTAKVGFGENVG